ncbi:MAG: hypothetical protein PHG53_09610 [Phycisphaerae bacterium]|nr:hypothetical protein [Phycisphaerae bacterium]
MILLKTTIKQLKSENQKLKRKLKDVAKFLESDEVKEAKGKYWPSRIAGYILEFLEKLPKR